jgi:squalene cyclase
MILNGCRYVECTSAAIQALTLFKKLYPGHRREEIENCIAKAAEFIEKIQASDGSWFASHCFLIYILHFCLNIILPVLASD